ncbi:MAG: DNRLRE domain-containing protein [Steroidobacteraceae bacterium]
MKKWIVVVACLAMAAGASAAPGGKGGGGGGSGGGGGGGSTGGGGGKTTRYTIAVTVSGPGSVTSSPSGINCSSGTCSAKFPSGTSLTLSAAPGADADFTGWSGASCSGTGPCTFNVTSNQGVTASFEAAPPPPPPPPSVNLLRGPYLQNVSTTGVTFRWRTDGTSDSRVWLGSTPGNLALVATEGTARTNHEVRVTGLQAGTRYYYAVGSAAGILASGNDHFVATAPTAADPTRIWVLGDAGTAYAGQYDVRDAYYAATGSAATDLILLLGDNAYDNGTDAEYQAKMFDVYDRILRNAPAWSTLGNHDGYSASSAAQTGPYYDIFSLPGAGEGGGVPSGTEAYYSFDWGNIHFVCLNSYDVSRSVSGAMLSWLEADLQANDKDWLVAFFHHPPYSKGSHNSDTETAMVEMRTNALPILERHGVDLVLSGHSHSYERSMLIDGHYGTSGTFGLSHLIDGGDGNPGGDGAYGKADLGPLANSGAVYAVAGASGKISGGALNHPVMKVNLNVLGSMVLEVNGAQMDAIYLDDAGQVRDRFSLIKQQSGNLAPSVSLTSPVTDASFEAPASLLLEASASDADGSVARVDFYANSTLLGSDASAPYSHSWSGVAAGSYTLRAVAYDNLGAAGRSEEVAVTVTPFGGGTVVTLRQGVNSYQGMTDTTLRSDTATTNYGAATDLLVDGEPDYATLMRWDLSSIPAGVTVLEARLVLEVFNPSASGYELYALGRSFVENEATWQQAAIGQAWSVQGANGAADRDSTTLATLTPTTTGTYTLTLNPAGLALVQSWIDDATANHGLILSDYGNTDGADMYSSEYGTVQSRPALEITYR